MELSIIYALVSCLPLVILSGVVIILSWISRGRIEDINVSLKGLHIQFGKSGEVK